MSFFAVIGVIALVLVVLGLFKFVTEENGSSSTTKQTITPKFNILINMLFAAVGGVNKNQIIVQLDDHFEFETDVDRVTLFYKAGSLTVVWKHLILMENKQVHLYKEFHNLTKANEDRQVEIVRSLLKEMSDKIDLYTT